jgi:hypothetical protein
MAMMAMTTSSSTSVKPRHQRFVKNLGMVAPPKSETTKYETSPLIGPKAEHRLLGHKGTILLN